MREGRNDTTGSGSRHQGGPTSFENDSKHLLTFFNFDALRPAFLAAATTSCRSVVAGDALIRTAVVIRSLPACTLTPAHFWSGFRFAVGFKLQWRCAGDRTLKSTSSFTTSNAVQSFGAALMNLSMIPIGIFIGRTCTTFVHCSRQRAARDWVSASYLCRFCHSPQYLRR